MFKQKQSHHCNCNCILNYYHYFQIILSGVMKSNPRDMKWCMMGSVSLSFRRRITGQFLPQVEAFFVIKISLLSKGGPELIKINKTVSPEFEKSTEWGSCSRYFIDESDVLWRAFSSWALETSFAKLQSIPSLHICHIVKGAELTFTLEIGL